MSKFVKWFKNYWYYYKFYTIVGVILLAIAIFAATQYLSREKYDYNIFLCFNEEIPSDFENAVELAMSRYGEDIDGDGMVKFQVMNYSYSATGKTVDEAAASSAALLAELQRAKNYLFITDAYRFKELNEKGVFGQHDFCDAYDKKVVTLDSTEFEDTVYAALQSVQLDPSNMPKMLLSIRKAPEKTKSSYKNYKNSLRVIEKIADTK